MTVHYHTLQHVRRHSSVFHIATTNALTIIARSYFTDDVAVICHASTLLAPCIVDNGTLAGCPSGQRERSVKPSAYAYAGSNPAPATITIRNTANPR